MFLDKHGIKLNLRDVFPINLCGVEDSVENYQTYLMSCCTVMVFEFYGILFFRFFPLMISMLNYALTHILF